MEDLEKKEVVVIPVKNEELTIGEIVKSAQKYTNDIIIIDGQSVDHIQQIACEVGCCVTHDHGKVFDLVEI